MSLTWFDAHLDLALLAVRGRSMLAPLDPRMEPYAPASVTLPALAEGDVRFALATIFTEVGGEGPEGYPEGDAERAYKVGRAQMEAYLTWRDKGRLTIDLPNIWRHDPDVGEIRGGMGVSRVVPLSLERRLAQLPDAPALHIGILVENAEPIRSPGELPWWRDRGVVAIGLAWTKPSRYAGGNTTQIGLTDIGKEMVRDMDRLAIVHDASHLSDRALADLFAATGQTVIASHSNCRALLGDPSNQRHLTDDAIREIARRGGVIGLNLYSKFLAPGLPENGRATLDDCVRHIEHICALAGDRAHVGLGSDMDGGFSAARLPLGIDRPADLVKLAEALRRHGWSDDDIRGFAWKNWARFWSEHSRG